MQRYRQRNKFAYKKKVGTLDHLYGGQVVASFPFYIGTGSDANYIEEMERCFDETHPGPPYREGGNFSLFRSKFDIHSVYGQGTYSAPLPPVTLRYSGGFVPLGFGTSTTPADLANVGVDGKFGRDFGDPSGDAASAYKRFSPKTKSFDGGTFIGEFREVPSMFKSTAKHFHDIWKAMGGSATHFGPKKVADAFLEQQFGWAPFISDMGNLARARENHQRELARFRRANDQWLRRHGVVRDETKVINLVSYDNDDAPHVWPVIGDQFYRYPYPDRPRKFGNTVKYVRQTNRTWFEGVFKYYIPAYSQHPTSEAAYWKVITFLRQYGIRVSPSVVWNLTPWSWMIDWFTNAGDVIENLSNLLEDQLVSKYAYIMSHTSEAGVNDSVIHLLDGDVRVVYSAYAESKHRLSANPFGFSLSGGGLSLRQLAIIGALGISKGNH